MSQKAVVFTLLAGLLFSGNLATANAQTPPDFLRATSENVGFNQGFDRSPIDPSSGVFRPVEADEGQLTFEERLAKLEKGWAELDTAWDELKAAEKKKKDDDSKKPTFDIGGRIHADFWDFHEDSQGIGFFENPVAAFPAFGQDPEDVFAFRRIRLEMDGDIPDSMLWRMQVDFNTPEDPEIKDVYLGFKDLPGNQTLLIGNQKRPMGLDHLNSSRYNVFLERPMVVEAFNEDARRPGIAMYGSTDDQLYHWRYGAYYLNGIADSGGYRADARQMSLDARLSSSPWYDDSGGGKCYYHWAVSGRIAHPDGDASLAGSNANEARFRTRPEARSQNRWLDTGRVRSANWNQIIAAEQMLNIGPTQLVGEYQHNFLQRETGRDVQFGGGYAYLSYFLTGEHIPYDRKSGTLGRVKPFRNFYLVDRCGDATPAGWGAWNIAARYSYLDLTDEDVTGGIGKSGTLAINWHWNAYAKLQFNLIYGEIDDRGPIGGYSSGNYLIAGTRFACDF